MRKYTTETQEKVSDKKVFSFLLEHWRLIGIIFLFFFFSMGTQWSKAERVSVLRYGYNEAPLNVRAEMDIESDWISQYPRESKIAILEDLGDWYRVENGYVKSEYVFNSITIYQEGKILKDAPIYAWSEKSFERLGVVHKDSTELFVKKENGYLELHSGGYVKDDVVTFDFVKEPEIHPNVLTIEDMKVWNMINLPIQYLGTLVEKTAGNGVTNKSALYFRGDIPIYDIIDGYAYFPSGRNIYKISMDKFSKVQNVGEEYDILAAYRTVYYGSASGRKHNIGLVATYLDGTIINPGKTFSYNKTTGPRSKSMGYELAGTIVNGETVPDYGGGVCQVSSTIYAAILNRDNFKTTARKAHGTEVMYLPLEMDATVNYGSVDFKFINVNPFRVKLNVKAEDSICLVTITRTKE